jgi:hypothetical protein
MDLQEIAHGEGSRRVQLTEHNQHEHRRRQMKGREAISKRSVWQPRQPAKGSRNVTIGALDLAFRHRNDHFGQHHTRTAVPLTFS